MMRLGLLISLSLLGQSLAHGDTPKFRQVMAVWDTREPSDHALTASELAARQGWTEIASPTTAPAFLGDAVVTNGRVLIAVRKRAAAVEVYALGEKGSAQRLGLHFLGTGNAAGTTLQRATLVENARTAVGLEVVYATAQGGELAARLRLKKGEVTVQVDPGQGADRLQVECPSRFVVLPDFFADDIVVDARSIPPEKIDLPSENFLLHLTSDGNALATLVFENRKQDVVAALAGAKEQRLIMGSEIPFESKKIWVALLDAPGVWHTHDVNSDDAGKTVSLDWKMPFPAHWRLDFTRNDDLTDSWDMLLQRQDRRYVKPSALGGDAAVLDQNRGRWNTVLGNFSYPCWVEQDGHGFVRPFRGKPISFRGPAIIYPINRVQQTPLDVYTVVDIMRNTLGVGPCEHILDLEGQKAEYKGRATCSVRDTLGPIYARNQQKQKRAEIEKILNDGLIFVTHIRSRITRYVDFGHTMRDYLAEQKKLHPELSDFLDEMDRIAREIDERVARRADKIQTPAHVAKMNEAFRKDVLADYSPEALAKCRKYTEALVVIGDNQDELSGECRWVVKSLRQRAGIRMALDPRVASIATDIRARTQEALRNPANHESARH
jgi:hypothetical protein